MQISCSLAVHHIILMYCATLVKDYRFTSAIVRAYNTKNYSLKILYN